MLQRVKRAKVVAGVQEVKIAQGLLVLVSFTRKEKRETLQEGAWKIARLRLLDGEGKSFHKSLLDLSLPLLLVPNFTLSASLQRGLRPDFSLAAPFAEARELFTTFALYLRRAGVVVLEGFFGENMAVELVNDGPATFVLDFPFKTPQLLKSEGK